MPESFGLIFSNNAAMIYLAALTLVLSFSILVGCIVLGFHSDELLFLSIFVLNVSWVVLVFLVGLEMISFLMRGFSFCVNVSVYSCIAMLLIVCLLLFVLGLGFFVALVQAFVLVVLVCLYMKDFLIGCQSLKCWQFFLWILSSKISVFQYF